MKWQKITTRDKLPGWRYTEGNSAAIVEKRADGYYSCVAGRDETGVYSESEDIGPFATLKEARFVALELLPD